MWKHNAKSHVTRSRARTNKRKTLTEFLKFRASAGGKIKPSFIKNKSKTVTIRKKKLDQGVFEERGGSSSKFNHGTRAYPRTYYKLIKAMPRQYGYFNGQYTLDSTTPGLQAIATGPYGTCDFTDFNNMFVNAGKIANNSASTVVNNFNTQRLFVKRVTTNLNITNPENYQISLTIYDCICRRDGGGNVYYPNSAWAEGLNDETYASGGTYVTPNYTVVGATPFESNLFCKFWKVQKITHTKLAGGQFHTHRGTWAPRRLVDNEMVQNGGNLCYKGLTTSILIVISGAPVTSTAGPVTTQRAKALITWDKTYDYGFISQNTTSMTQSNFFVTSPAPTIMNEAQEKLDTFATA